MASPGHNELSKRGPWCSILSFELKALYWWRLWFCIYVDTNPFESKHFHDVASSSSPVVVELLSIALPQFIAGGCNKILLYCSWHTAINENDHFVNNALAIKTGHILQCFQLRNEMNVSTKLKAHCLFTRLLQCQDSLDNLYQYQPMMSPVAADID